MYQDVGGGLWIGENPAGRACTAGACPDLATSEGAREMSTSNDVAEVMGPSSEGRSLVDCEAQVLPEVVQHKANARRVCLWLSPLLFAIAVGAFVAGVMLAMSKDSHLASAAFIVAGFFLIFTVVVPAVILREGSIQEEEEERCKEDCDELIAALDTISDATIRGLAKANFKQLRMFTVIAVRQARMSYYASLVAASVSLLVLASGAAVTDGLAGTSAKVAAASLTTVGVALSGFLSATFLSTYRMAARQMSYYYGQPLVHCYLLHAERLALMLAEHPERKVDTGLWREVVNASIRASENAQNHLLDMQELGLKSRVKRQRQENQHYPIAAADATDSGQSQ